jgi:hypothetical protein
MWLLSFLPTGLLEFIINATLVGSIIGIVLGFFGSKLPFVSSYLTPIKYISIALFCVGLYWKGGFSVEKEWRERVEAMEIKVKQAEAQAQLANEEIEAQTVEKTKLIREKGKTRVEYINRLVEGKTVEIVKDMSAEERAAFEKKQKELLDSIKNCPVPKIIVEEHNKAAELK